MPERAARQRPEPDRISTGEAGLICGFSANTMRKLAEDGKVPGAAFLGNAWRFDVRRLREWVRRREAESCRRDRGTISSGATASGTLEFRSMAGTSDERYAQLLGLKPKNASRR